MTFVAATPPPVIGPQCAVPGPVVMAATDNARPSPPALLPQPRSCHPGYLTCRSCSGDSGRHPVACRTASIRRLRAAMSSRVFSAAGDAAVEGAPIELSPAQLGLIAAGNVTRLGRQGQALGRLFRPQRAAQRAYETPDGHALVPVSCATQRARTSPGAKCPTSRARSRPSR